MEGKLVKLIMRIGGGTVDEATAKQVLLVFAVIFFLIALYMSIGSFFQHAPVNKLEVQDGPNAVKGPQVPSPRTR